MKTLTLLLALLLIFPAQDTVTYTNPDLNLTFQFPKNWTVQPKKNEADVFFPVEGSEEQAKLEIRAAVFFSEVETWQEVQAELAKSTRRELVKQWQDQLLGVPLVLTQVRYTERGVERTRQTGMMYGATRKKLVYHLTAPSKVFEQAEATFKAAMQSMRTIDGVLPQPEVPGREKGPYIDNVLTRPPLIMRPVEAEKKTFLKAPQTVACTAGGQNLLLRLPSGFSAEKAGDGKFTLKHAQLSTPVSVTVQSTLDSDQPEKALIKATAASLDQFAKVEKREDGRRVTSRAGAFLWTAVRSGPGQSGSLVTFDAVGQSGDAYWMLSGKWTSPQAYNSDKKLLDVLVQEMSLELAQ